MRFLGLIEQKRVGVDICFKRICTLTPFLDENSGSKGTAYALEKFGIGRQKTFDQLLPGDFINLNRTYPRPGHAVVFMGFINSGHSGQAAEFSSSTIGFKYFSAQGQNRPDGGFGYRDAYFEGHCPTPRGKNDDCNVIKAFQVVDDKLGRQNQTLLNSGELLPPSSWRVKEARAILEKSIARSLEAGQPELVRSVGIDEAVKRQLESELAEDPAEYIDGSDQ